MSRVHIVRLAKFGAPATIETYPVRVARRSYGFVVFGDALRTIHYACSSVPAFDRYAVMPVAGNVCRHVVAGKSRRLRPAPDHREPSATPERAPGQPARPVDVLNQRRVHVREGRGGDVGVERVLGPVVRWDVEALDALLGHPEPPARAPPEVVVRPGRLGS